MRTRVKICGIRSVEDALFAAHAGADAVGMIQVPGAKRRITIGSAAQIAEALPAYVTPVLVFADAPLEDIRTAATKSGIRTIQLHGNEPVETVLELRQLGLRGMSFIKCLKVGPNLVADLKTWSLQDRSLVSAILLESPWGGGTGVATNWDEVEAALTQIDRAALPPLVLAGGLGPENVESVIRRIRPFGVDTSSGVENPAEPGRKDPKLVEAFLRATLATDRG